MEMVLIHLGSVALLAIAVEALCRVGRFRPALCHALWLVVLVKLMAPPVVAWPVRMGPLSSSTAVQGTYAAAAPTARVGAVAEARPLGVRGVTTGGGAAGEAARVLPGRLGENLALKLLLGLWVAGTLVQGARILLEVRRARRRMRSGVPLPAWLHARLASASAAISVRAPRAMVVREARGIYLQIAGVPVLVVSDTALTQLDASRWNAILTHELAHLKRRDHWVAWLLLAAGVVWWWNPCLWWARRRIHLYSELACDAWVVATHPGERKKYAETMVHVLAMLSRQQTPAPAMGLAVWSGNNQKRRLKMIMKAEGACSLRPVHALLLALAGVVAAPAWLAPAAEDEAIPLPDFVAIEDAVWVLPLAPTEEVLADLDKPVTLNFENAHLSTVLASIRDNLDVNLVLDQRVVAPPPEDGVETPDGPKGGAPYVTDGMVSSVDVNNVPVKKALAAICKPLGLTYQVRGSHVWVSSPEQLRLDRAAPVPYAVPGNSEKSIALLESLADLEYENIHIRDFMEVLQDKFDINVVIDKRAALQLDEGEEPPQFFPPGVELDTLTQHWVVRELKLKEVSVAELLYIATRQVNLSYSVQEGFLFVSSEAIVSEDSFRKLVKPE